MTAAVGHVSVLLGLALSAFGASASALGYLRRSAALVRAGRIAAFLLLPVSLVAMGALSTALLTHDFSLAYVAQNGSRDTPAFYTAISTWASLEGSILLWVVVLAGYIAVTAKLAPRKAPELYPVAQAVLLVIAGFFFWLVAAPADPFQTVFPVPADGSGPNPLLQNHPLMAFHPPALYLGLVGFSVPFAFAIAALVSGRLDATWIRVTRGATLVAWSFLALGNVLGAWWAYAVLGWGGYFAWDPVENVSLVPWLTATAFLHSVMVQEKREMLKLWNLTLVVATFALTILSTFLTRSGVLSSVHAFGSGLVGPALLAFIAVTLAGSIGLLLWRSERLRGEGELDSPVSRESAFLLNNLLLIVLTLTVLVGTLFPLFAEALNGTRLSVGEPYFNSTAMPIALALLFLMGVGPALPWRKTSRLLLRKRLLVPSAVTAALAAVLVGAGVREPMALAAVVLGGFVIAQAGWDLARISRRRALRSLHRRVGGQVAHIGFALIAIGVAVSSAYQVERQATLERGESMRVESHAVRFDGLSTRDEGRRRVQQAELTVDDEDKLRPALNRYSNQRVATASPAIRESAATDIYAVLVEAASDGSRATIRVFLNPLVTWLWVGGVVILLGSGIAALPTVAKGRERAR